MLISYLTNSFSKVAMSDLKSKFGLEYGCFGIDLSWPRHLLQSFISERKSLTQVQS